MKVSNITLISFLAALVSTLSVIVGPQGILLPIYILLFLIAVRGYVHRNVVGVIAFWVLGVGMAVGLVSQIGYLLRISSVSGLDAWSNASIILALTAGGIAIRSTHNQKRNHAEQQSRHVP